MGIALSRLRWRHHASMQGQDHCTNRPPRGIPRVLDDIWASPNMIASFQGSSTSWEPGWCANSLLTMSFLFNDEVISGTWLEPPPSKSHLQQIMEGCNPAAWNTPRCAATDIESRYNDWIDKLNAWLPQLSRRIGVMSVGQRDDPCNAQAPVKPRAMWRANIARKLHHQIVELHTPHQRAMPGDPPSERSCQLFRAVCRAPWQY